MFCCAAISLVVSPRATPTSTSRSRPVSFASGRSASPRRSQAVRERALRPLAEERAAGRHRLDRGDQVLHGEVLEQVAVRAFAHGAGDVLRLGVHGEHDDVRVRRDRARLAQHREAVAVRHVEVEQQHVGLERRASAFSVSAPLPASPTISRPGTPSSTRRTPARTSGWSSASSTRVRRRCPDDRVPPVGHSSPLSGSSASTRRPPAGAVPSRSSPPTKVTRSRIPSKPRCGRGRIARAVTVVLDHEPGPVGAALDAHPRAASRRCAAPRW